MRGSAAFRTSVAPGGALAGPWVKNELWRRARAVPSLDLRFAENKSLVDATTGTNLIDFTRASSGTYVGSDGLIKTATTNLLLRSEEFNQGPWGPINATIVPNQATAPDGTLSADQISETTPGVLRVNQVVTVASGTTYTASIFLKAGSNSTVVWREDHEDLLSVEVNLATGSIVSGSGAITPVGNGWYRVSFTGSVVGTIFKPEIRVVSSPGTLFAWGAQLEQSSTVGEYIPTTSTINSAPRFDHDPTTGESLGLLVEEQRQNLLPSSVYTSNANGWTNGVIGGTGAIASAVVANKSGNTSGVFNISELDATSYVGCIIPTLSSTTANTASVFVKNNGGTVFQMRLVYQTGGTFKSSGTQYTFATGAWQDGVAGTLAPISRTVQDMGDGWLRFSITAADNGTGNTQTALLFFGGATPTNYNYYFWGAQLEEGSFPTSYIPTTTSAVTRAADVASISGTNFSSWYRQDEGTVFVESLIPFNSTGTIASFDDGTLNNRWQVRFMDNPNRSRYRFASSSGSYDYAPTSPVFEIGSTSKAAFYAQSSDQGYSIDSIYQQIPAPQATMPNVSRLELGNGVAADRAPQLLIKRLTYWPTRLPNETLQGITQQ